MIAHTRNDSASRKDNSGEVLANWFTLYTLEKVYVQKQMSFAIPITVGPLI